MLLMLVLALGSCGNHSTPSTELPESWSWQDIEQAAAGTQLSMMMWQGDPLVNRYMVEYVKPALKQCCNIDLQLLSGQGHQIVSTLMAEREAGLRNSQLDVVWINGETFFQLRQIDALYGPFTSRLPNSRYINWEDPFISRDFGQPLDGYECPWGNVQMTLIYNSSRVQQTPHSLVQWEQWWAANPGLFTLGHDFTGMTLLKAWLMELAGGPQELSGPFDPKKYEKYSAELWALINRNKANFWNGGRTFPSSVAQMHQLFAQGELLFTMSNNDAEVDNKIAEGFFPDDSRAYVPRSGTIQNSHYLGIARGSVNKAAAMVLINWLISPEAQFQKYQPAVWGDGTILSLDLLEPEWQERFETAPGRVYAPARKTIQPFALQEPDAEYMIRLFADFRAHVIAN